MTHYLSTHSNQPNAWERLKRIAQAITPQELIYEAKDFGAPDYCSRGCCRLEDHAKLEFRMTDNNQLIVIPGDDELTNHIRLAFTRLVIRAAHKESLEVIINMG